MRPLLWRATDTNCTSEFDWKDYYDDQSEQTQEPSTKTAPARRYFAAGRSVTGLPPAPGNRDFAPPEDSP